MSYDYTTVAQLTVTEKHVEKSRFICALKGISNAEEAKDFIAEICKAHPFATHNCYAYITEEEQAIRMKYSDDGEPQGTAGLPMLEVLKLNGLHNVVAVVTRYFGGIKLCAGGLVRAYSSSVADAVKSAKLATSIGATLWEIRCDYENYTPLLKLLTNFGAEKVDTQFDSEVIVTVAIKNEDNASFQTKIKELFGGKPNIHDKGQTKIFV